MSNIQPLRPVAGVYPPCPPVPCPPVPCPPFTDLERCYEEVKRAQAFLKQMLIDIINCDPSLIGRGTPIVGVTDGTDAQPGMVGEFIQFISPQVNYVAGTTLTTNVTMGVLPAGDWDCWAWGFAPIAYGDAQMSLSPQPAGFSGALVAYDYTDAPDGESNTLLAPTCRALTSEPSLINYAIQINRWNPGEQNGYINFYFNARRRR